MASKPLGKLRQWVGKRISRCKTVIVEDDLEELEQRIELRKESIIQLQAASEDYYRELVKGSSSSGGADKPMPLDALGVSMAALGEEYGEDSVFGMSLISLGRAHCKIAMLQEAYGRAFKDTFIPSCERFAQDVKDYEYQREKLDSRRQSYDAALAKLDEIENHKTERAKEIHETEDELNRCRILFEETSEDVRCRTHTIQEDEILQLRELTNFLDIHMDFAREYFAILNDVKARWCDEAMLTEFEDMRIRPHSTRNSRIGSLISNDID